jgi:hypothetical protein
MTLWNVLDYLQQPAFQDREQFALIGLHRFSPLYLKK